MPTSLQLCSILTHQKQAQWLLGPSKAKFQPLEPRPPSSLSFTFCSLTVTIFSLPSHHTGYSLCLQHSASICSLLVNCKSSCRPRFRITSSMKLHRVHTMYCTVVPPTCSQSTSSVAHRNTYYIILRLWLLFYSTVTSTRMSSMPFRFLTVFQNTSHIHPSSVNIFSK